MHEAPSYTDRNTDPNFQVCSERANCSFAFNLCGEFAFEATPGFASRLFDLLPMIDAVFGNASELKRFAEIAVSEGRVGATSLLQGETFTRLHAVWYICKGC